MEGRLTGNYIQGKWNIASGDILIFLSEHVLPGHFCGDSHLLLEGNCSRSKLAVTMNNKN